MCSLHPLIHMCTPTCLEASICTYIYIYVYLFAYTCIYIYMYSMRVHMLVYVYGRKWTYALDL